MIEAESLCASYGNKQVVRDVSFSIEGASVVGFLGPNGAGKSTTMRMLSGYLRPYSGRALICGLDAAKDRIGAQARIGYLPESAHGFDRLLVIEFLEFCARARGLDSATQARAIRRVSQWIDVGAVAGERLATLSKGWRQRVWFAQALLHDPDVLILDEPTDGLDPNQKRAVRQLVLELAASKTILLSTHILEEAEALCTRVIVIADGTIVVDTETTEMMDGRGRMADRFYQLTATKPVACTP